MNLQFNEDLLAERETSAKPIESLEERFEGFRGSDNQILEQVLNEFGLFDEPHHSVLFAELLLKSRLSRQTLIELNRVTQLWPDEISHRLRLARAAIRRGLPDKALEVVEEIRSDPERFGLTSTNDPKLLFIEAEAHLKRGDEEAIVQVVETALANSTDETNLYATSLQVLLKAELYTNAMEIIEEEITRSPEDADLLVNKGFVLMRLQQLEEAVEVLTEALALDENNIPARQNRAIANLRLENYELAKSDYDQLLLIFPDSYEIYYGLGEIAFHQQDTNLAIYNYNLYLENARTNTPEAEQVRERLQALGFRVY